MPRLVTRGLGSRRLVVRGLGAGSPSTAFPATLYDALDAYLARNTSLSALTGVYLRRPAAGATYPHLILSPIGGPVELNLYGHIDQLDVQFTVLANDDSQAWDLGTVAYWLLFPRLGNPRLVFADGYETTRTPVYKDQLTKQPGRAANNKDVWAYSFSYRWLVSRGA